MKKLVCIILVMLMALTTAFTGCSKKPEVNDKKTVVDSNMTEPGQLPIVKQKVTLKALAGVSAQVENIETNAATKWFEDKTNVHIEWQVVKGTDASQKVNLMLASKTDLPDIIINAGIGRLQQAQYGSQGMFIPLEGMVDKYGFWIKKANAIQPSLLKQMTAPDNHIYGLGAYEECYQCTLSEKMWLNKTWLDKVGMSMPKTTDDFYNVLKAFKEKDPNGNGKKDEIPMTGAKGSGPSSVDGFLMNAFIYDDGKDRLNLVDNKVIPAFIQPEWKDGLNYLSKLSKEGLIDPEMFVQDATQVKQLIMGDSIRVGSFPSLHPGNYMPADSAQTKNYTAVPPLTGPKGNNTTGYYPTAVGDYGDVFVILKDCKNPEVAFRWTDFMYSEDAYYHMMFGAEDVDWRKAKEGETGIDGKPAKTKVNTDLISMSTQNQAWTHLTPHFVTIDIFHGRSIDINNPWYTARRLYDETKSKYDGHQPKQVLPSLFMAAEDAEKYGELKTTIDTYLNESTAKFILGKWDTNADWDKYISELKKMGLDEYVKIVQKTYDRQYMKK